MVRDASNTLCKSQSLALFAPPTFSFFFCELNPFSNHLLSIHRAGRGGLTVPPNMLWARKGPPTLACIQFPFPAILMPKMSLHIRQRFRVRPTERSVSDGNVVGGRASRPATAPVAPRSPEQHVALRVFRGDLVILAEA